MKYIKRICNFCGNKFQVKKWRIAQGRGKYCSPHCRHKGHSLEIAGDKSPNWNGGIYIHDGYKLIRIKNHPHANPLGYIREHRVIMEKHLGRYMKPEERIHHLNGNKQDNRIENLQIVTIGEHNRIHKLPRNKLGQFDRIKE